jgi:replication factor C subunit 3/5
MCDWQGMPEIKKPSNKMNEESESSFIQKALVENIRLLWADKYRPRNLNGFTCHKEQVHQLKQLVTAFEFFPS